MSPGPWHGQPGPWRLRAPAKLNLYLDVLGKRADGYHEIVSIFHAIDLEDHLRIERRGGDGVEFAVEGRPCPDGPENLVPRAAEALFAAAGERVGVRLVLEKRVPMGAGLGGGSSDAGAVLRGLNRLLARPLPPARLDEVGASLGSDVPFFLHLETSGTAICRGRGEHVEPVEPSRAPRLHFVVVFPRVHVPTPAVYGAFKISLKNDLPDVGRCLDAMRDPRAAGFDAFHNALTTPLRALHPDLAGLQDRISTAAGRAFHVTGSGSAMYTALPDAEAAAALRERLSAVAVGEVFVCRSAEALADESGLAGPSPGGRPG